MIVRSPGQSRTLPLAVQAANTTRSLAVKVALRAPYDRAPWRAVTGICATARGSNDFPLGLRGALA